MTKTNENGRSMVEMLGVLAIIGVLSAGGLAGYSKAMYKYRVNETMNQLTMIVSNIRTLFGSQNTYAGLDTTTAYTYGIVTADMMSGSHNSQLKNPFKGKINIGTSAGREASVDTGSNEAFYIEYEHLPAEACVTIVTSDWGSAAGSGLIGIAANGTGGTGAYESGTTNGGNGTTTFGEGPLNGRLIKNSNSAPFTIMQAVTACGSGNTTDTSQNASIALKYY